MVWIRKGIVHLLSLVLLISLVGIAFATSGTVTLAHPAKIETLLSQGNFYTSVVANELHDAQQSSSDDQGAGRISLNDPAVQQAVNSVFTPQLLKQYTNTVLNGNYAWLEGKTNTPQFTIDLKPAKERLAQQIGQQVEKRVAGLPVCSVAQLTQLQATLNSDPLSISCRLPDITPQTAAKQATDQINESSGFLNNPVITANALNPNGTAQGRPYYQRLSAAPKLYKWGQRLPWIFGVLILLSALGIFSWAPRKRRGVRRIAMVAFVAGVILLIVKLVSDTLFNHVQKRIFTNSTVGQLQQSLTDFLHRLEAQLVKIDLWFAVAFLIIGLLLFAVLWFTRARSGKKPGLDTPGGDGTFLDPPDEGERMPLSGLKQHPRPNPQGPKPPRLIQ